MSTLRNSYISEMPNEIVVEYIPPDQMKAGPSHEKNHVDSDMMAQTVKTTWGDVVSEKVVLCWMTVYTLLMEMEREQLRIP